MKQYLEFPIKNKISSSDEFMLKGLFYFAYESINNINTN